MIRLFIQRWILSFLAGSVPASAFAADIEVEMRPEVAARSAQVFLGDVAYVRAKDFDSIQRLVNLPLGRAPRVGSDARLSRDTLLRWARSQLGSLASRVEWTGADEVLISHATREGQALEDPRAQRDTPRGVARGEWVTLLSRHRGIELESPAEALQDGQLGQAVRVRSAGASGSVVARVVAPGRVEIGP